MRSTQRSAVHPQGHPIARHSPATIALHWASALLFVLAAASILVRELVEDSTLRVILTQWHRQIGMLVLLAWVARLWVRMRKGMAQVEDGMPPVMRLLARAAHWVLYGLILAIPLLGWALSSAHGVTVTLFGVLPLPALVEADSDLADALTDDHVMASWSLLAMVVLHVAAALYHHHVRRDQVLAAMLPAVAQPRHAAGYRRAEARAPA